jgi:hypothetical protein
VLVAGHVVTGLGIASYAAGVGYPMWRAFRENRSHVIRRPSPWDLLGCLSVAGLLVFATGLALVATARRLGP